MKTYLRGDVFGLVLAIGNTGAAHGGDWPISAVGSDNAARSVGSEQMGLEQMGHYTKGLCTAEAVFDRVVFVLMVCYALSHLLTA